jgi:indole-3-glycerol phosphate synthase
MTILGRIAEYKRREIADAKARIPYPALEALAAKAAKVRPFRAALERSFGGGGYGLIAEIKRASPSKGLIRAAFDPAALARAYESGGATCLSVLTDGPSFQGSTEHLIAARTNSTLPVLRKDFLFEPYQVAEARAMGADCILIILAAVDDRQARAIDAEARRWGMDVLVEVHDEDEMKRALAISGAMIGVNNRDLKTFVTDLEVCERLAPMAPPDRLLVAESGLGTSGDLARMARAGIRAFLIGESLMRAHDVAKATREILTK